MKKVLGLVMCCLLLQVVVFGQSVESEQQLVKALETTRVSELTQGQVTGTDARLIQTGDMNSAVVRQRSAGVLPNTAFITQVGDLNTVILQQSGQGNQVSTTQIGNSNTYRGEIDGVGNSSTVLQMGTANQINQRVYGTDLDYTLIQNGNNNSINQIESTSQSRPYTVVQQGNNMNITVEQSQWGVPVRVK